MSFELLVMATALLGLLSSLAWGAFHLVTRGTERAAIHGQSQEPVAGFLVFGAMLALAALMIAAPMALARDAGPQRTLAAVIGVVAFGSFATATLAE